MRIKKIVIEGVEGVEEPDKLDLETLAKLEAFIKNLIKTKKEETLRALGETMDEDVEASTDPNVITCRTILKELILIDFTKYLPERTRATVKKSINLGCLNGSDKEVKAQNLLNIFRHLFLYFIHAFDPSANEELTRLLSKYLAKMKSNEEIALFHLSRDGVDDTDRDILDTFEHAHAVTPFETASCKSSEILKKIGLPCTASLVLNGRQYFVLRTSSKIGRAVFSLSNLTNTRILLIPCVKHDEEILEKLGASTTDPVIGAIRERLATLTPLPNAVRSAVYEKGRPFNFQQHPNGYIKLELATIVELLESILPADEDHPEKKWLREQLKKLTSSNSAVEIIETLGTVTQLTDPNYLDCIDSNRVEGANPQTVETHYPLLEAGSNAVTTWKEKIRDESRINIAMVTRLGIWKDGKTLKKKGVVILQLNSTEETKAFLNKRGFNFS